MVEPDTDNLIADARQGDDEARQALLARHRSRLRRMVAVHLDRRLAPRVDPSDVVQETLGEAAAKLSGYLRDRPLPFYPWLRRLALERLVKLHRRHVRTQRRSIAREEPGVLNLPDESAVQLAQKLIDTGSSPSKHVVREELRRRVRVALAQLGKVNRDVLVMRYLEGLATSDIAAALGLSEAAVKMRHLRALDSLRKLMADDEDLLQ